MRINSIFALLMLLLFSSGIFADSTLARRAGALEREINILKARVAKFQKEQAKTNQSTEEIYAHGPAIVSSPLFGARMPDDAYSSLMVKLPSINHDMLLLLQRKKIDNYATKNSIVIPNGPMIALSGALEGQLLYEDNYKYTKTSKTNIELVNAELHIIAEAGPWMTAAMVIDYDDSSNPSSGNVAKSSNSRLRLSRGFFTIGQLSKSPFYFTIGQSFAPFGSFGGYGLLKPITRRLGRVKDRMMILGYNKSGMFAQIYGLAGETKSAGSAVIRHTGANIGYKYDNDNFGMLIGGGVLGNLAESQDMQAEVFGRDSAAEAITSRVHGYNAHAKFTFFDKLTVQAEYVGASKAFEFSDLAFNGSGAKPQAFQTECGYKFKTFERPSAVFAGYALASQALALGLPKHSFFTGYNIAILPHTLFSIEYRRAINYRSSDTASAGTRSIKSEYRLGTDRGNNTVAMRIGIYF